MSLWRRLAREAHRRSLWQVLGVYALGGWIGYQVILALYDGLALPEWVPPLAIVLFLIGLPIVLATAMVQEGGPTRETFALRRDVDPTLLPELESDAAVVQSSPLARHLTWRRSLGGGVLAFALLAVGATGFVVVRTRGTLVAQGVLGERDVVVLAEFETRNAATDIGGIVTEALRIDLQQSNILRLAEPAQIAGTLARMRRVALADLPVEVAREVAEREGWKAVLAGEIGAIGGSYVLTAQLVTPDSGRVLASFKTTAADSTALLRAVDELSKQVRAKIGESLAQVRAAPALERVSTTSLPALRKYVEGTRIFERTGDQLRAIELFEHAIALDSTFAMAWRRRGIFLGNMGIRTAQRDTSLTRAYQLRDRLSEIDGLLATAAYESAVRARRDVAIETYRRVLQLDPDHPVALNNLGNALIGAERYEDALAPLERAVANGATTESPYNNLVAVQFRRGDIDGAYATLARARAVLPENVAVEMPAMHLAAATGKWEVLDSIVHARYLRATNNTTIRVRALLDRARVALAQGRIADHFELIRELDREVAAAGAELQPQARSIALGKVSVALMMLGDTARALRELDDLLRRFPPESFPPGQRAYFGIAELYAAAGRFERADALVREAFAVADSFRIAPPDADGRARARIALLRGDAAGVLQTYRRVGNAGTCKICDLPLIARAYELAGHADSARAAYEDFLTLPHYQRMGTDPDWRAIVLLRAAELHEAAGDTARAIERYAEFVRLWAKADPALQPRVHAAQARIARLRGPG